jgi:hypothetical protein
MTMTPEEAKEARRAGGPGRKKNPTYGKMEPVYELYVKIRNLTRKSSKRIPIGQLEALREERILLSVLHPGLKLNPTQEEMEDVLDKESELPLPAVLEEPKPVEEKPKFTFSRD